jgi:deazaflavin-dependent oxidoreductase (nitroreductase family)
MKTLVVVLLVGAAVVSGYVLLALLEGVVPRRTLRWYQKHIASPLFGWAAGMVPGWVMLETIGRKTGMPRRVPVGGHLEDDTCWILAGTGRDTHYVRNIEENPNVREKLNGHWRGGIAQVLPDDDPRPRLRANPIVTRSHQSYAGSDRYVA